MKRISIKRSSWLVAGLSVCCLLVFSFVFVRHSTDLSRKPQKYGKQASVERAAPRVTTSTVSFVDSSVFLFSAPTFWTQAHEADLCSTTSVGHILLLPHYVPVYPSIERTIAHWAACQKDHSNIRHVIVIGPDHHHRLATGSATLSTDGYASPLGDVMIDSELRARLIGAGAQNTSDLFLHEHGVGLFPIFAKEWFSEATFTPLVISSHATHDELAPLVLLIKSELNRGDTLLVVTADFSHYLAKDVADARDQETIQSFAKKDTSFFWSATDEYTDFGRGIWFAWQVAGLSSMLRLDGHLNSVDVGGSQTNTTSFFLGWWE